MSNLNHNTMKQFIFSMAVAVMLCACGGSASTADSRNQSTAPTSGQGDKMTDARMMGLNGNVKYAGAPTYMLGFSRFGFDTDGYINEFDWAIENGAKNVRKDTNGRLVSFTMEIDECDEVTEYPASISRDADGRISKILYQDINYIFSYSDDGRLAKVTYRPNYNPEDYVVYQMEYDPDGDLTTVFRSYPDGSVNIHRFEYNQGKDANGNWVKRVEHLHQNGEDWDPRTEERILEYY